MPETSCYKHHGKGLFNERADVHAICDRCLQPICERCTCAEDWQITLCEECCGEVIRSGMRALGLKLPFRQRLAIARDRFREEALEACILMVAGLTEITSLDGHSEPEGEPVQLSDVVELAKPKQTRGKRRKLPPVKPPSVLPS